MGKGGERERTSEGHGLRLAAPRGSVLGLRLRRPPRPCLALSCCREKNWEIDMICPVPDGSRPAAIQVRHGPVAATRVAVAGIILGVQGPRGSSRGAGARDLGTGSRRQGRGLVVRAGAVASIHHSC